LKNRQIYQTDPETRKLVNQGVANVNDDTTIKAMEVLRYELETFVCDGQYGKGMEDILDTYLKNISQSQQPAVWISGFYGSGKSHLVKMLRALWVNTKFSDGATSRGIANLPQNIQDQFKELTIQGKKHGGIHAASGTLGAGASGSVRLALLRIIFKSVGLPELFHAAKFVMWLKKEDIYDKIKSHIENQGDDFEEELDNFYVSELLHETLVTVKPKLFSSVETCAETLFNIYPLEKDITNDQMLKAIKDALSENGKFPLTLIVLDEVQQFIGENGQKSIEVQEVVETCCKNIGAKILFIGTGQTAVTGTSNLKKLEGRFTVRIELSDADVDTVVRKVILAKKPEVLDSIENIMQKNIGEISRHLGNTSIAHQQRDIGFFTQDYPILPVRRRFWEITLRALDQTGTDSQLRNQLSMIHKVIQTNLDNAVGSVVPADYLYFDSADKLLQTRILPRKIHDKTLIWYNGSKDERIKARATGLIFLINKLAAVNKEIGIKADVDTIADLMITDLTKGSSKLRSALPALLDSCELLMKVENEYRIQTEESTAWNDEFNSQKNTLANQQHKLESERNDRIKKYFNENVKRVSINHGDSKILRQLSLSFSHQLPSDSDRNIYIWIRDGWNINENSMLVEAKQAGNQAPTIYVHIPNRSADDLRRSLIEYKAASATLLTKGHPNSPEGREASSAMETTKRNAENKIKTLIEECLSGVKVFQAGGNEIFGNDIQEKITEAGHNSLKRLYSQFQTGDHKSWDKVYANAKKGAPDALKAVGYSGEVKDHPVCKAVFNFIAGGKKGAEIREHFTKAPYGWSQDAVDGSLQALFSGGLLKASDDRGKFVDPNSLERKNIGKTIYKMESANVSAKQKIKIVQLFQLLNIKCSTGELGNKAPSFLQKMDELANKAGGEAPKPNLPDTNFLKEIRLTTGNEQLLALFNQKEIIEDKIAEWKKRAEQIEKRLTGWNELKQLAGFVDGIEDAEVYLSQISTIEQKRQLLEEPDLIQPLITNLTQVLREELNKLKAEFEKNWDTGESKLKKIDENWKQLEPEQKHSLRVRNQLLEANNPAFNVETTKDVLDSLSRNSLPNLRNIVAALSSRYNAITLGAAKLMEPKIQEVDLPSKTLKSEADIVAWLKETEALLKETLKKGPVMV